MQIEMFITGVITNGTLFSTSSDMAIENIINVVIVTLIIWLFKEFRTDYLRDKEMKTIKADKLKDKINKSLLFSRQYMSNPNNIKLQEFYSTIYDCFSFWKTSDIKEIKNIISDKDMCEKCKVRTISSKLDTQFIYINKQNQGFSLKEPEPDGFIKMSKDFFEGSLYGLIKPFMQTIVTIIIILSILVIVLNLLSWGI